MLAERNHRNRNQRHGDGEERREQVEELVDVGRHQVFLGDQLDHVGQRLQQPVRADARGPDAHLDVRDDLAFHPLQIRQRGQQNERHDDASLDQADNEKKSLAGSRLLQSRCFQAVPDWLQYSFRELPPLNSVS